MALNDYVIRVLDAPSDVAAADWDGLLQREADPSPFMRHAYLSAMHDSGSATTTTGWSPRFLTLWRDERLAAACPLYLKSHSYGEYVFDWAWANAYAEHGLAYYPKALVAVPFTPVPGARLLALDTHARTALVRALLEFAEAQGLSSAHLLFAQQQDIEACAEAGLMLRHTVQFRPPASSMFRPVGCGRAENCTTRRPANTCAHAASFKYSKSGGQGL